MPSGQFFLEERQSAFLGQGCRSLVVTRCRVIVETVIDPLIEMGGILLAICLERRLIGGPAGIHAFVTLGVVKEQ